MHLISNITYLEHARIISIISIMYLSYRIERLACNSSNNKAQYKKDSIGVCIYKQN